MDKRCITAAFLSTFFLLFLPVSVFAEEKPLWEIGAGLALLQMPDYRGSDENRLYLLPYPYAVYRGDFLSVDGNRITGRIFKTDQVALDVSAYGSVPVDSSKNSTRRGMEDLDATFELGPALKINLWSEKIYHMKLDVTLPVRAFFPRIFLPCDTRDGYSVRGAILHRMI